MWPDEYQPLTREYELPTYADIDSLYKRRPELPQTVYSAHAVCAVYGPILSNVDVFMRGHVNAWHIHVSIWHILEVYAYLFWRYDRHCTPRQVVKMIAILIKHRYCPWLFPFPFYSINFAEGMHIAAKLELIDLLRQERVAIQQTQGCAPGSDCFSYIHSQLYLRAHQWLNQETLRRWIQDQNRPGFSGPRGDSSRELQPLEELVLRTEYPSAFFSTFPCEPMLPTTIEHDRVVLPCRLKYPRPRHPSWWAPFPSMPPQVY